MAFDLLYKCLYNFVSEIWEDLTMNGRKIRTWATPLMIGSFALSAITGILLFFHVQLGLAKVLHQWFSWLLVMGGLFHVMGSWRPFTKYFFKPLALGIIGLFALFIVVSFIPAGDTRKGGMPANRMAGLISETSLETVAAVADHQPEEVIKDLTSKGLMIKSKDESIREIAVSNGKENSEILGLIF
jgi:hypothetical protein